MVLVMAAAAAVMVLVVAPSVPSVVRHPSLPPKSMEI
jgi:hypothetical protein